VKRGFVSKVKRRFRRRLQGFTIPNIKTINKIVNKLIYVGSLLKKERIERDLRVLTEDEFGKI
jgi:hypothetical protein